VRVYELARVVRPVAQPCLGGSWRRVRAKQRRDLAALPLACGLRGPGRVRVDLVE